MFVFRLFVTMTLAVVLLPVSPTAIASSPVVLPISPSPPVDSIAGHVAEAARRFGIPDAWIWAVMRVESGGDPRALSSAGAMGLMQIMPATWTTLRTRYALGDDVYDRRANIMAGAAYLREMHDRYSDPIAMLAAYNAGPGRYDDYRSRGRPLPAETVAYITKLAPMIGSGTASGTAVVAPPDPLSWTRSGLFAVRAADTIPAEDDAANRPPNDRSVTAGIAPEKLRETLFVAVSRYVQP